MAIDVTMVANAVKKASAFLENMMMRMRKKRFSEGWPSYLRLIIYTIYIMHNLGGTMYIRQ